MPAPPAPSSLRRVALLGALLLPASPGLRGQEVPVPPAARTVPALDTTAAGVVADPYRWLEATETPEVRRWARAQHRVTDELLRGEGGFEDLRAELHSLLNDDIVLPPAGAGGLLFFERQVSDARGAAEAFVVEVASSPRGPRQTLLDPRQLRGEDETWTRFTDVAPDPSGRRVLVGLPDGAGGTTLRIWHRLEVSFGPERLPAAPGSAAWMGPGRLVWARPARGAAEGVQEVVVRDLETGEERVAFTGPRPGRVGATPAPDGAFLVVTHRDPATPPRPWPGYQGPSGRKPVWVGIVPLEGGRPGAVRPLLAERDAHYRVLGVVEGTVWLLTTPDDGFGRVLAVESATPGARVDTVFEATDERIVDAALAGDAVAVGLDEALAGRILVLDRAGERLREIRPPKPGPVQGLGAAGDDLYFRWSSFLRRVPVHRVELDTGREGVFQPVGPGLEPDEYTVRRVEYPSADGTSVPLFLVHPRGPRPAGGWPTLLYAYGGWGWNVSPWYHQRWATWLESGGAVAIANVRGGGERGQPWHDAGKKGNRADAVADLQAAAEWLAAEGHTSRERLGVLGLSAGAPTVGSAVLGRPDLFGAMVLEVGLLDLVRFGVAREFGDPALPGRDEAEAALAFSPYHRLDAPACLPPTLVVTSEDDNLYPQALKFTARAQAAQRCPAPVLLHVGGAEGHLPTGRVGAERHLNELLFFRSALGLGQGEGEGSGG